MYKLALHPRGGGAQRPVPSLGLALRVRNRRETMQGRYREEADRLHLRGAHKVNVDSDPSEGQRDHTV